MLWGNCANFNRVFLAQKKCVRAIFGLPPYESCKPLFLKLNILPLPCLYIFETCVFVKKHMNLFKTAKHVYPRNTRHPGRLVHDYVPRTAFFLKQSYAMCMKLFNKLPTDIQELPFNSFRRRLEKLLNKKQYYSVKDFLLDDLNMLNSYY